MFAGSLTNLSKLGRQEIKEFIDSIDTVLTDCDGVLWLENHALEDAPEVMNRLRELGKRVFFVTNNSRKFRIELAQKCNELNFKCSEEEMISTSYLVANYLKDKNFDKKVYVVGTKGITHELDLVGIKHTGTGPDVLQNSLGVEIENMKLDPEVGAVVVGFDEHFSYLKMLKAVNYLNNPDCLFLATNTDERFPMPTNFVVPGSGCVLAGIQMCAGREPFIVGKPHTYLSSIIMQKYNMDPQRTLMIGDKCNTDILLGTRCGFQTMLVLTGVTTLEEVMAWKCSNDENDKGLIPDVYLEKLGDLLQFLD